MKKSASQGMAGRTLQYRQNEACHRLMLQMPTVYDTNCMFRIDTIVSIVYMCSIIESSSTCGSDQLSFQSKSTPRGWVRIWRDSEWYLYEKIRPFVHVLWQVISSAQAYTAQTDNGCFVTRGHIYCRWSY